MEVQRLYCHICRNVQRDRRAYRDHLLRVHGEVIRRGIDTPVRLVGRELEIVWAANYRRQMSGPERAARRREALGLPRARAGAPAPVTAPDVPATPDPPQDADTRPVLLIGRTPATPLTISSPSGRSYSPCAHCLNCPCRVAKNYSGAQASSPIRFPSRTRSPSARRGLQRHPRSPSPGPPLLGREAPQDEGPTDTPSWDEAQAMFSQGAEAMSQGSAGSPVLFLDPAACEDILADLRGKDGRLPSFSYRPSRTVNRVHPLLVSRAR